MFGRRSFLKYVEFKFITLNDKRDRIDIILARVKLNCEGSIIQLISANVNKKIFLKIHARFKGPFNFKSFGPSNIVYNKLLTNYPGCGNKEQNAEINI